jgi:hypothetical protein
VNGVYIKMSAIDASALHDGDSPKKVRIETIEGLIPGA